MRTGILGGTFDPIHVAHLHAGETALASAELDRVLFMPAGDPWQKTDREVTPSHHRLEMCRLAVSGVEGFEVDDRELGRDGPTYTIDTVETFPSDEELFLILGADAALGLPTWRRIDEVLERVTVLVVPRVGFESAAVEAILPTAVFLDMALLGVSGTKIRQMSESGDPFRFLVPAAVYRYIEDNRIYAQSDGGDSVGSPTDLEETS